MSMILSPLSNMSPFPQDDTNPTRNDAVYSFMYPVNQAGSSPGMNINVTLPLGPQVLYPNPPYPPSVPPSIESPPDPLNAFPAPFAQTTYTPTPPPIPRAEASAPTRELSMTDRPTSASRIYLCRLCPPEKKVSTRGSFKRHVRQMHNAEKVFKCPAEGCDFYHSRSDKFREHYQTIHDPPLDLSKTGIKDFEVVNANFTRLCPVCQSNQFQTWDEWFACFESHC